MPRCDWHGCQPAWRQRNAGHSPADGPACEFHEPLGRKLVRQLLHALAVGRPHLGDLRHSERTEQRDASDEAEGAASSARDKPCLLANRSNPDEALGNFEHQLRHRLGFAVDL
jgi:hypothetical protein